MKLSRMFMMHVAGSLYENLTFQSHTQRRIRRKVGNLLRRLKGEQPLRSWEDGRTNAQYRAVTPTDEECERLNREAARSI